MPHMLNKTLLIASVTVIAAIISSCTPKVTVNAVKDYSKRVDKKDVIVYNIGDSVPSEAEYIGNVMVTANNTATEDCSYEKVLDKAVKATSEYGGNLLALTYHKEPEGKDLCHEVAGNIMWFADGTEYSALENERREKLVIPENTFYINIGLGSITSDLYVEDIDHKASNSSKNSVDFALGYDYMFSKHVGVGAVYSGFKSSVKWEGEKLNFMLNMLGIQLVFKQRPGQGRFIFEERIGLGYMNYTEWVSGASATINGFGSMVQLGAEYLLTQKFGIALNMGSVVGQFGKYDMPNPDGGDPGIGRFTLDFGVRIHF